MLIRGFLIARPPDFSCDDSAPSAAPSRVVADKLYTGAVRPLMVDHPPAVKLNDKVPDRNKFVVFVAFLSRK